jgi:SAM-dependent methyltransferase
MEPPDAHTTVGSLYEDLHLAWASGAEPVYGPMAQALVRRSPIDLTGRAVLDVGAGTGAGSRALTDAGARPIALDLAFSMLAHDRERRPPAAVADLFHPPIRQGAVAGVLAPFVLNHVAAPVDALVALSACAEPGGVVLASTFSEDDRDPVKDVIDAVALDHGWEVPDAYRFVRDHAAPLLGHPDGMAGAAAAAGLAEVHVVKEAVDTGVDAPEDLVAYRFALPQFADFLSGLAPEVRTAVVAEAVDAVARARPDRDPLALVVLLLSARVG